MGRPNSGQLPRDVVRDLLGIARALYRERNEAGAAHAELVMIESAGKALTTALDLSRAEPDTVGHRAAWGWADKGLAQLAECLRIHDASTARLVETWGERLRKKA